jgi:hypothetical protein
MASRNHYSFDYKGIRIDPYRIFRIYQITDPAQQHAIKKLLRAGRSVKSLEQDIDETIATLTRWKQMIAEDTHEEQAAENTAKEISSPRPVRQPDDCGLSA